MKSGLTLPTIWPCHAGAIFKDTLKDNNADLLSDKIIEFVDIDLEKFLVEIPTDHEGNFSHGPIAKGDYYYRVDVDGDGWYDLNQTVFVGDETSNITLDGLVPDTSDVTLTLVSPDKSR